MVLNILQIILASMNIKVEILKFQKLSQDWKRIRESL